VTAGADPPLFTSSPPGPRPRCSAGRRGVAGRRTRNAWKPRVLEELDIRSLSPAARAAIASFGLPTSPPAWLIRSLVPSAEEEP